METLRAKAVTLCNPYTGLNLTDDPALYSLNLVNEAALPASWNRYPALIPVVESCYAEHLRENGAYTPERRRSAGRSSSGSWWKRRRRHWRKCFGS